MNPNTKYNTAHLSIPGSSACPSNCHPRLHAKPLWSGGTQVLILHLLTFFVILIKTFPWSWSSLCCSRFERGDIIEILETRPNGLWRGRCGGRVGTFKFVMVEVKSFGNVDIVPHAKYWPRWKIMTWPAGKSHPKYWKVVEQGHEGVGDTEVETEVRIWHFHPTSLSCWHFPSFKQKSLREKLKISGSSCEPQPCSPHSTLRLKRVETIIWPLPDYKLDVTWFSIYFQPTNIQTLTFSLATFLKVWCARKCLGVGLGKPRLSWSGGRGGF